ncbi:unnamed protein product, partial [Brenthis ino]
MLYNALTAHTKEDKECNRNIIEQTYSEISMPLHDNEILPDVDLVEPSTSSGGVHSSHNQVDDKNTPCKRRLHNKQYCAISTQVKIKSNNEKNLLKRKKVLEQKLKRQNKYIDHMKSLLAVVKKYTSQSDIENIIKGNFSDLCKLFKKSNPPNHPQGNYASVGENRMHYAIISSDVTQVLVVSDATV